MDKMTNYILSPEAMAMVSGSSIGTQKLQTVWKSGTDRHRYLITEILY